MTSAKKQKRSTIRKKKKTNALHTSYRWYFHAIQSFWWMIYKWANWRRMILNFYFQSYFRIDCKAIIVLKKRANQFKLINTMTIRQISMLCVNTFFYYVWCSFFSLIDQSLDWRVTPHWNGQFSQVKSFIKKWFIFSFKVELNCLYEIRAIINKDKWYSFLTKTLANRLSSSLWSGIGKAARLRTLAWRTWWFCCCCGVFQLLCKLFDGDVVRLMVVVGVTFVIAVPANTDARSLTVSLCVGDAGDCAAVSLDDVNPIFI